MLSPLNRSLTISIPYIDPQPPDISWTSNSVHSSSAERRSNIDFSASLRWVGAVSVAGSSLVDCGEEAEGIPEEPSAMVPRGEDSVE